MHFCAAADPAGACIWSHLGPCARPSLLIRVLSRRGSAHCNSHIPRNLSSCQNANSAWHRQPAVGEMDLGTVRQAVERELKISKRLQGILVVGEFRSVKSHLKIAWADTVEEARLCFRRGAVRNKDRWAFNSAYAQIRRFVAPLPCDLRIWQLVAQRSLHMHSYLQLLGPALSWLSAPAAFLCRDLGSTT